MTLKEYLATGIKQIDFAKIVGVNNVLVSQWANGVRRVPAEHCPTIERVTGGRVRCETLRSDIDWATVRTCTCKEIDQA